MQVIIENLVAGNNLSPEMASLAFGKLMDGDMTAAQAGAFLTALRMKGETPIELLQAVKQALKRCVPVTGLSGKIVDIVGTGGDGRSSFNCSTLTAFILAGMGYKVVKHGNRAVSSICGSADLVESLGIPLELSIDEIIFQLNKNNFVFLFAPFFHPTFKNIMPIRREIGMPTLFNILGPLLNPARPTHSLIGVTNEKMLSLMAETLSRSGIERSVVVHGAGNYDELTPIGVSDMVIIDGKKQVFMSFDPEKYGIPLCNVEDLTVNSKNQALEVAQQLLNGEGSRAMQDMLICNVGVALYILEAHSKLKVCMDLAKQAVYSKCGLKVLNVA